MSASASHTSLHQEKYCKETWVSQTVTKNIFPVMPQHLTSGSSCSIWHESKSLPNSHLTVKRRIFLNQNQNHQGMQPRLRDAQLWRKPRAALGVAEKEVEALW